MKENDLMSENFGKEIPEPKGPVEPHWAVQLASAIIVACLLSLLVAGTIRLDKWILH